MIVWSCTPNYLGSFCTRTSSSTSYTLFVLLVVFDNDSFFQLFQSYFDYNLKYLEGGIASGFTHVEAKEDKPNLYKIKGSEKGLSMSQMPMAKSSLNGGDSFILFVNAKTVWVWHGAEANPDEKAKANTVAEKMCTEGTAVVLNQGDGDEEDGAFWGYIGSEGEIAPPEEGDELIEEFAPLLFKITGEGEVEQVAKAEKMKSWRQVVSKFDKSLLDDNDVFLLDAGWEVFLWMGNDCDKSEKLSGVAKADTYMVRYFYSEQSTCLLICCINSPSHAILPCVSVIVIIFAEGRPSHRRLAVGDCEEWMGITRLFGILQININLSEREVFGRCPYIHVQLSFRLREGVVTF